MKLTDNLKAWLLLALLAIGVAAAATVSPGRGAWTTNGTTLEMPTPLTTRGVLTAGDIIHLVPKATAPATCAIGDIYADTSGAICGCAPVDTWSRMNSAGTCV